MVSNNLKDDGNKYNQKLSPVKRMSELMGFSYKPRGRTYDTLREDIWHNFLKWLGEQKGYRAILSILGLIAFIVVVAYKAPQFFLVIPAGFITYPFAEIFAGWILKGKMTQVISAQHNLSQTILDVLIENGDINEAFRYLEGHRTAIDVFYLYDFAWSSDPSPSKVQIVHPSKWKNSLGKDVLVVDYVSPDGRFASGDERDPFGNLFIMKALTDFSLNISKKYLKTVRKIEKEARYEKEDVQQIKACEMEIQEHIEQAKKKSIELQRLFRALRVSPVSFGTLHWDERWFVGALAKSKEPWMEAYLDLKKMDAVSKEPLLFSIGKRGQLVGEGVQLLKNAGDQILQIAFAKALGSQAVLHRLGDEETVRAMNNEYKRDEAPVPENLDISIGEDEN